MRIWAIKRGLLCAGVSLCLTLTGCGGKLLERSYSTMAPHSAAFWENEDADTLRAENYQDLVNALLLLLGEHSEDGVVRIYGDAPNKAAMAENACVEVQKETPIGAYLLDYITYDGVAESGWYELTVHFGYRRTAEEQAAIINATSTEALPEALRAAIADGRGSLALRVGYFDKARTDVMALVQAVHDEVYPPAAADAEAPDTETPAAEANDAAAPEAAEPPETAQADAPPDAEGSEGKEAAEPSEPVYDVSPWEVLFYPDSVKPGIVEILLHDAA